MYGETQVWMPLPSYDVVRFRFFQQINKHGNFPLPNLFYGGVIFGISDGNSHDIEFTGRRELAYTDLRQDLNAMFPKPTAIMMRSCQTNSTGWSEEGYAVYFSYNDLKIQGKLSSDPSEPWKRVLQDMLLIARHYRQTYLTLWYPHTFGQASQGGEDPNAYTNIIQEVVPTRTGLNEVRSKVAVWLSSTNLTEPEVPSFVSAKEWTAEDRDLWSQSSLKSELL